MVIDNSGDQKIREFADEVGKLREKIEEWGSKEDSGPLRNLFYQVSIWWSSVKLERSRAEFYNALDKRVLDITIEINAFHTSADPENFAEANKLIKSLNQLIIPKRTSKIEVFSASGNIEGAIKKFNKFIDKISTQSLVEKYKDNTSWGGRDQLHGVISETFFSEWRGTGGQEEDVNKLKIKTEEILEKMVAGKDLVVGEEEAFIAKKGEQVKRIFSAYKYVNDHMLPANTKNYKKANRIKKILEEKKRKVESYIKDFVGLKQNRQKEIAIKLRAIEDRLRQIGYGQKTTEKDELISERLRLLEESGRIKKTIETAQGIMQTYTHIE
ncbi:MAG: hypothetical protein JSR80_06915 [Verrucomicrobia bacterium]|nr:hypothetical protein [Verrucomicrobiota bacterium]